MINSRAENQANGTHSSHHMHIGLHRDPKHQSRWLDSRPIFTNWYSGEPNNSGGREAGVELYTQTRGLKWNDLEGTGPRRYICETSGESIRSWPKNPFRLDITRNWRHSAPANKRACGCT